MFTLGDTRSTAFYLLLPLLFAALFPTVQAVASVMASLVVEQLYDAAKAETIRTVPAYILTVTAASQLIALGVIGGLSRGIRVRGVRFTRRMVRRAADLALPVLILTLGAQMAEGSLLAVLDVDLGLYTEVAEIILEADLGIVLITVAIIPGICEEIIFRGIIQPSAVRILGPVAGIAYTAALFGVVHIIPIQVFAGFFFGIIFGYLRFRSGSVLPAIIAHIAANAMIATFGHVSANTGAGGETSVVESAATGTLVIALFAGVIIAVAGVIWFEIAVRRQESR